MSQAGRFSSFVLAMALLAGAPGRLSAAEPVQGLEHTGGEAAGRPPIVDSRAWLDDEFFHLVGVADNRSGKWVGMLRLDLRILDAGGKVIYEDYFYADRQRVAPGEPILFSYIRDLKRIPGRYASYDLRQSVVGGDDGAQGSIAGVQVQRETLFDDDSFLVTGTINSVGRGTCENATAVVGFYDGNGKLYAVSSRDTGEELAPGQGASFRCRELYPKGVVKDVKVWPSCDY